MHKTIPLPKLTADQIERIWGYVEIGKTNECWNWIGLKSSDGYGKVSVYGRTYRAHRLVYFIATSIDPSVALVCHNCPHGDNPLCCNPKHLWAGTASNNSQDRENKGRGRDSSGVNNPCAKLTPAQVRQIRQSKETQQTVADRLGVSRSLISMVRNRVIWTTT